MLPQLYIIPPIHLLLDEERKEMHFSKARRTESGRVIVDTALLNCEYDATNEELFTSIATDGSVVNVDASLAMLSCKNINLISNLHTSRSSELQSPGDLIDVATNDNDASMPAPTSYPPLTSFNVAATDGPTPHPNDTVTARHTPSTVR